jgi:inhibitor of cysteine peptidase
MKIKINTHSGHISIFIMLLILVTAGALALILTASLQPVSQQVITKINQLNNQAVNKKIVKFTSEDDFKNYLTKVSEATDYGFVASRSNLGDMTVGESVQNLIASPSAAKDMSGGGGTADRVSTTNVQVAGIDEPDIVKTDGREIYFSGEQLYWAMPEMRTLDSGVSNSISKIMPPQSETKVKALKAWPVADLGLDSEIIDNGTLLLKNNKLMVFSNQAITAYDVTNPKVTSNAWTYKFKDNSYLVTARLYKDNLYVIMASYINRGKPCPLMPLENVSIKCADIYHPFYPTAVDTTFTVLNIDPESGKINKTVSLVGGAGSSVIYMSDNLLYLTYNQDTNSFDFMVDFLLTKMKDLIPTDIFSRLNKLTAYDLNAQTKMTELGIIMQEWQASLSADESLRLANDMQNLFQTYYENNKRNLFKTEVVSLSLDKLEVKAEGLVPGHPLNQYSLDEYNGYLRLATTLGDTWSLGLSTGQASANDVYILDASLKIKGSVKDLGLTERIYAVRFLEDKGYVVTFRQTDPFYVLDLSNPSSPILRGELKIPGYSSYLHPLAKNKILGLGQEGGNVKISYFDVSDPTNPREISKYTLSDYGSEALYDPHAFLQDDKHKIFFIPGNQGGYVFSYVNDELKLVKALSSYNIKRAVYLNDYLYIIGNEGLSIFNELDWQEVNKLDFKS